jgi:hypothetical protein
MRDAGAFDKRLLLKPQAPRPKPEPALHPKSLPDTQPTHLGDEVGGVVCFVRARLKAFKSYRRPPRGVAGLRWTSRRDTALGLKRSKRKLLSCRPENISETRRSDQHRSFSKPKPSGFPLRSLWPIAKLPFDREQKNRYLAYLRPARVLLLLVTIETEGFVADDPANEARFFVCFSCGCRSSR